jgi:hypothetical protein
VSFIKVTVMKQTYNCAPMSALDEYAVTQRIEQPIFMGLNQQNATLDEKKKLNALDIRSVLRVVDFDTFVFIYEKMFEWGVFLGEQKLDIESFQGKTGDLRVLVSEYVVAAFSNFISGLEKDIKKQK